MVVWLDIVHSRARSRALSLEAVLAYRLDGYRAIQAVCLEDSVVTGMTSQVERNI